MEADETLVKKMAGILTSLELYAHLRAPGNEDRKDSSGS